MKVGSTRDAGSVAVEVLARAGVRRFYTVPGESFLEILDAVEQHHGLWLVSTRLDFVGRLVYSTRRFSASANSTEGNGHCLIFSQPRSVYGSPKSVASAIGRSGRAFEP